jgi:hypothetical protein
VSASHLLTAVIARSAVGFAPGGSVCETLGETWAAAGPGSNARSIATIVGTAAKRMRLRHRRNGRR